MSNECPICGKPKYVLPRVTCPKCGKDVCITQKGRYNTHMRADVPKYAIRRKCPLSLTEPKPLNKQP